MIVRAVGIVGAGTMGQGIAVACAAAGLDVLVSERSPDSARGAMAEIVQGLDNDIAKWRRTESEKKAILARIRTVESMAALEAAQIVVEAVPDDLELKTAIFQELDRVCPPEDILATNTSALSVSEIAARTQRPDRILGLHFVSPVPTVPLVEVVRGLSTSDETLRDAVEFVRLLGKTAIEVFESPGYVTTRVILPFINEAMYVVMEGVATAEAVDTSMRLGYGMPLGPLALADRMGLDEVMRWTQHLFDELGDLKYRPCPLLRKMVRAGRLGVKSGSGFFEYDDQGRIKAAPGARALMAGRDLPVDPARLRKQFPDLTDEDIAAFEDVTRRILSETRPEARARLTREIVAQGRQARERAATGAPALRRGVARRALPGRGREDAASYLVGGR